MAHDEDYRTAAGRSVRLCAFCSVPLEPLAGLTATGEYACARCLAADQIRVGEARAQSPFAVSRQARGGDAFLFAAIVFMVAMPLAGALVGARLPKPSGDYGGGLVAIFHMAVGFGVGGACSLGLGMFTMARRRANRP